MFKILKKDGFASFVEIVVTAVIFIVAGLGLFTSISMLRPQGADSAKKLEAAYIGKQVIDQLRAQVDARTWNSSLSNLAPNVMHSSVIDGYTVNYFLLDDNSLGIRQLYLNVYYNI